MTKAELKQKLISYGIAIDLPAKASPLAQKALSEHDWGYMLRFRMIVDGKSPETAYRPDLPSGIGWAMNENEQDGGDPIVRAIVK